jgi:hypothetical protein
MKVHTSKGETLTIDLETRGGGSWLDTEAKNMKRLAGHKIVKLEMSGMELTLLHSIKNMKLYDQIRKQVE